MTDAKDASTLLADDDAAAVVAATTAPGMDRLVLNTALATDELVAVWEGRGGVTPTCERI